MIYDTNKLKWISKVRKGYYEAEAIKTVIRKLIVISILTILVLSIILVILWTQI